MKRKTALGWEQIEHDPVLRRELREIEEHHADETMVTELMEFFARVEGMVLNPVCVVEEEMTGY